MTVSTLSFAQTLRVVGQALEPLHADYFELEKSGDEYVVWMRRKDSAEKPARDQGFVDKLVKKVWRPDSAAAMPNLVRFPSSEVHRLDNEGRSRRRSRSAMPDAHSLSLGLRALGGYLDRHAADDFAISWTAQSITVSYKQKQESFTLANLYDLGVSMYLKRSSRSPAS